ncbi:unnamed protein product, partial [marine sediment metagenome]
MTSWKTTLAGLALIITALGTVASALGSTGIGSVNWELIIPRANSGL